MKKINWYIKVLKEKKKDIVFSMILGFILILFIGIWYWLIGRKFEWQNLELVSQPSFLLYGFYSALVYITLGSWLYNLKFYKKLYNMFVVFLGDRKSYNEIKKIVWLFLTLLMCFFIVPIVIDLLNGVISLIYNLLIYCLYVFPLLAMIFILIGAFYSMKKYLIKNK